MNHSFTLRLLSSWLLVLTLIFPVFSQEETQDIGEERITHFHSELHVQKNCTVKVTESISVVSHGIDIRHGIYRDLPLSYDYQGGRTDVGFQLVSVKRDGQPEDYHTESLSNGIRINIGSEDTYLDNGRYTFEVTYVVDHVLGLFDEFDEFYWNVNGNGWKFRIDSVSANVYPPEGATVKRFSAYTGASGSKDRNFASHAIENGLSFGTTQALASEENMTIAVAWDKNHLVYPTAADNFIYWLKSHFLWIVGLLGLLITLIYNTLTWFRYGRDPKPGTIMPLYEAPEGFSPADAAFLYNYGRSGSNLFTSQLVGLGTKGRLTINVDDANGMISRKTYTITRTDPKGKIAALLPVEEEFYQSLFGPSDRLVFSQRSYNPHLQNVQQELVEQVRRAQGETYILQRSRYKLRQYIVPFLALIAGLLGSVYFGGNIAIPLVCFAVCFAANIVFGRLYEQPTPLGRKKLDELAGYKLYMQYADRERIRLTNPPTMDFHHFEANLPYAIALGVADEWSQKFDQAELQRATSSGYYWYTGAMIGSMHAFDFSEMTNTISSASTPPSSSSSGSGGGGFSGGGGGGGGGGGW